MGMDVFTAMGDAVARRWDDAGTDERVFAAIAEEVLVEHAPHAETSFVELCEWALFSSSLPPQRQRPFGQPPVNVYVGAGFYIEANVWTNSATSIHHHGFSGAFCLLTGQSLHTRHQFDEDDRVNSRLQLGRVSIVDAEILVPGQVRRIDSGNRLIHCVLHLERPSVSVVIRTNHDMGYGLQLDYVPPFVAVDNAPEGEPLRTRLELIDALAVSAPEQHLTMLKRLLSATHNRYVVYRLLARSFRRLGDTPTWAELEALATVRHGAFVSRVAASIREGERQEALIARRSRLTDARTRLPMAMLTVLPGRSDIERLIRRRHPTVDPEDWIVDAVAQLAEAGALELKMTPISLTILRCLLRNFPFAETLAFVAERFPGAEIRERAAEVERARSKIRCCPALRPLFVAGSGEDDSPLEGAS